MRNLIMPDIIMPENYPEESLKWETPQDELDYWRKHPKTQMPSNMWDRFYCQSIQHRGLCCSSCLSDEEYSGFPNFDDKCCCKSKLSKKEV